MNKLFLLLTVLSLIALSSCSSTKRFTDDNESTSQQNRFNNPSTEIITGIASYYGKEFQGNKTASGEVFNMYANSAAHKTYPLGTEVRITNLKNNKSVVLKINDRMPIYNNRLIDVSFGAAKELDMLNAGLVKVKVEVLKWGTDK
jgi:rare lipoprotein A